MATNKNITVKQFNGVDYDTLYPKTSLTQVEGLSASLAEYYSKNQTLNTDTMNLFVGADVSVPNGAFKYLGKYAEHWWSSYQAAHTVYSETKAGYTTLDAVAITGVDRNIQIAYSVNINQTTGAVSLNNPINFYIPAFNNSTEALATANELKSKAPFYVSGLYNDDNNIRYVPVNATAGAGSTFTIGAYQSTIRFQSSGATPASQIVSSTGTTVPAGQIVYLQSTNRNAYPDSGTISGVTYEYLGVPYEKMPMAFGLYGFTYKGTGEYGDANPTVITFPKMPKVFYIRGQGTSSIMFGEGNGGSGTLVCYASTSGTVRDVSFQWSGSKVSFYADDGAKYQLNNNGHTFNVFYFA